MGEIEPFWRKGEHARREKRNWQNKYLPPHKRPGWGFLTDQDKKILTFFDRLRKLPNQSLKIK